MLSNKVNRTVWVGNIHDDVTEELLYELFQQAGPLAKVHIPKGEQGGVRRNYAFVEFKHSISVPYTIKLMDGLNLFGRSLKLQCRGSVHERWSRGEEQEQYSPEDEEVMKLQTMTCFVGASRVMSELKIRRSPDMMQMLTEEEQALWTEYTKLNSGQQQRDYNRDEQAPVPPLAPQLQSILSSHAILQQQRPEKYHERAATPPLQSLMPSHAIIQQQQSEKYYERAAEKYHERAVTPPFQSLLPSQLPSQSDGYGYSSGYAYPSLEFSHKPRREASKHYQNYSGFKKSLEEDRSDRSGQSNHYSRDLSHHSSKDRDYSHHLSKDRDRSHHSSYYGQDNRYRHHKSSSKPYSRH